MQRTLFYERQNTRPILRPPIFSAGPKCPQTGVQGADLQDAMRAYRHNTGTAVLATATLLGEAWIDFGHLEERRNAAAASGRPSPSGTHVRQRAFPYRQWFGLSSGSSRCQEVLRAPAGVQRSQRMCLPVGR